MSALTPHFAVRYEGEERPLLAQSRHWFDKRVAQTLHALVCLHVTDSSAFANQGGGDRGVVADIFISYIREDRVRVLPLVRALERNGYTVWWDRELEPSQNFERTIKKELGNASCVIVVWTERSVGDDDMYISDWVQNEASSGAKRGVLVPVQFDPGRSHWRHRQIQYVELHDWSGDEATKGFVDLLKGVVRHAGSREPLQPEEFEDWVLAETANNPDALDKFAADHPDSPFAGIASNRAARATLYALVSSGHLEDEDLLACAEQVLRAVGCELEYKLSILEQTLPAKLTPEMASEVTQELDELSLLAGLIPWPEPFSSRIDLLRDKVDARTVPEGED